ncbi:hypothetical protein QQS21_003430 [Conoideocrella luteorostrata]|uniref:Uncharacterized protein n=1 Tax=Conoideocrella luteorostrata TaxID=1105319 RepID=A0AAJ0CXE0_9HYPO|nr:hypothetical protein QQS21_003430 [Conoideocrella luteorostrata]
MEEVIVIGIDFGTTYSGVAWAYSLQPENIEVVTSWESELNHCSDLEKTPTQLAYGKKGEPVKWGYTVPSNAEAVQWFKLLLLNKKDVDPDVYWCSQFCQAREMLDDSDENAVQMVASFLKPLWFHAIKSIKEELGEELLLRCQFHVIMTLPAIWPQYAQQRMEEAAKIAGILTKRSCGSTVLRFISEPEAAALATIKDLSKRSTIEVRMLDFLKTLS